MSIKIEKLKQIIEKLMGDLGDGFIATDIWVGADAQSLVGCNSQPKAVALLNEVTRKLDKTLKTAELPGLGNYYIVNIANNQLVVVLSVDTFQQFILVDLSKTTTGILMSVALPNLLRGLAEAETIGNLAEASASAEDPAEEKTKKQLTTRFALRELYNSWEKQWEEKAQRRNTLL